jgi:hypothetical protein
MYQQLWEQDFLLRQQSVQQQQLQFQKLKLEADWVQQQWVVQCLLKVQQQQQWDQVQ